MCQKPKAKTSNSVAVPELATTKPAANMPGPVLRAVRIAEGLV